MALHTQPQNSPPFFPSAVVGMFSGAPTRTTAVVEEEDDDDEGDCCVLWVPLSSPGRHESSDLEILVS